MLVKKQLTLLKKAKKLAKLGKIEAKSQTLIENTFYLFKDEFTETLLVPGNNISYYKNLVIKRECDSEDDVEMTNNNKNVLNINAFTKLLKVAQNSSNFES